MSNASKDNTTTRLGTEETREQLMVQIAKLSYELELNQNEIARRTGLTRWQVARLLKDARAAGIVRIEISPRSSRLPHEEAELQKRFGLHEAIVLADQHDDDLALNVVARAAGQYLASLSPAPSLVGVSWGRTMTKIASWLPAMWNDDVDVVLLNGAINIRNVAEVTNNVAERFAHAGNGRATLLPVPAVLGSSNTREALEADHLIADVLQIADRAPVACMSMGELTDRSVLVTSGYIDEALLDELGRRGAVGDILGRFIDDDGAIVMPELDDRTIGLRPERLRDKELAIGVCVGASKHRVARACLRAGYLNVLITDEPTARFLLESDDG
ncbi:sugar-binding transcriptional regulator [Salinisphaera sp. SWV1]|uniref:sugar-binding transcriptional regulator n=1 Tax=Salinisphaera sp. SWV1 TaxID=3454139 RepID=UPI003F8599E0